MQPQPSGGSMEPIEPVFPRYVGVCIYCGSESGLQDEHIVPLGLSGEWILQDASCSKCADITSAFEHDVQRRGLLVARSKLKLKTRRKKERPRSFSLNLKVGEETRTLDVALEQHPGSVIFPKFPPAAALSDAVYARGIGVIGTDVLHLEKDKLRGLARQHGASAVSLTASYEPVAFARMIGKIAYGFAVACYGPNAFREVPILASILGKSDEIGRWVGSDLEPAVNGPSGLHAITMQLRDAQLVAFVRLFAQFGTREYHAIVGSLRDHDAAA